MAAIKLNGLDSLFKKLDKIADKDKVKIAMADAVLLVHGQAKLLAPVNTGDLRGSIHPKVTDTDNVVIGKVYTNLIYAPYVEFGTGIKGNGTYPNKNISLTYKSKPWIYTPDEGETFYKTQGQVAQPYLYPALKQNEKAIKTLLKEALLRKI